MGLIIGLILASTFPLLFLGIIRKADFYQTGQFRLILLSLSLGVCAYGLTAITNNVLVYFGLADWNMIVRSYAPILEEIFKGLFLLFLVSRRWFSYSVDGAIYGFATGIGFAILENYEYVIKDPTIAVLVALQRIFSANLVHATGCAIIGSALGVFQLNRTRSRWLVLGVGLFLAIAQHMFYNMISNTGTSLVTAIGIGILGAVFIYLAMQRGKKQAQKWIKQKLGMEDRITRGEVAAVDRLPSMDNLLLPVLERFDPETASKVEKLLYLQARLGIKRKTIESFGNNTSMRDAVETEVFEMRTKMDAARRDIGAYAMLFVRELFTEEMVSVWAQVQAKILERSEMNGSQKGGGLWSSLEERLKTPADSERLE